MTVRTLPDARAMRCALCALGALGALVVGPVAYAVEADEPDPCNACTGQDARAEEIRRAQEQLDSLTEPAAPTLAADEAELDEKIEEHQQALNEADAERTTALENQATLQSELDVLERAIGQAEEYEIAPARAELDELKLDFKKERAKREGIDAETLGKYDDAARKTQDIEDTIRRITGQGSLEAATRVAGDPSYGDFHTNELDAARTKLGNLERQVRRMYDEMVEVADEDREAHSATARQIQELEEAAAKVRDEEIPAAIEAARARVGDLLVKHGEARKDVLPKLRSYDAKLEALRSKRAELGELEAAQAERQSAATDLRGKLATARQEIEALDERVDAARAGLDELKPERSVIRARERWEERRDELQGELDTAQTRRDDAVTTCDQAKADAQQVLAGARTFLDTKHGEYMGEKAELATEKRKIIADAKKTARARVLPKARQLKSERRYTESARSALTSKYRELVREIATPKVREVKGRYGLLRSRTVGALENKAATVERYECFDGTSELLAEYRAKITELEGR